MWLGAVYGVLRAFEFQFISSYSLVVWSAQAKLGVVLLTKQKASSSFLQSRRCHRVSETPHTTGFFDFFIFSLVQSCFSLVQPLDEVHFFPVASCFGRSILKAVRLSFFCGGDSSKFSLSLSL